MIRRTLTPGVPTGISAQIRIDGSSSASGRSNAKIRSGFGCCERKWQAGSSSGAFARPVPLVRRKCSIPEEMEPGYAVAGGESKRKSHERNLRAEHQGPNGVLQIGGRLRYERAISSVEVVGDTLGMPSRMLR